jgi:uncharacterized MAPEG superfamily protein
MPIELRLLAATLVLALVQILATAQVRTKQYGTKWNMGARDEEMPPLNPLAGRLVRAQANLFETLPLFIGAVLAATVTDKLGARTEVGAYLYFLGRLIYVPLYAFGIPMIRTLVWGVSLAGLILVIWPVLVG